MTQKSRADILRYRHIASLTEIRAISCLVFAGLAQLLGEALQFFADGRGAGGGFGVGRICFEGLIAGSGDRFTRIFDCTAEFADGF